MPKTLESIISQTQAEKSKVQDWQTGQRLSVEEEARSVREEIEEQISKTEKEAQEILEATRRARGKEVKKLELGLKPETEQYDETLERVEKQRKDIVSKGYKAREELKESEKEALTEIERMVNEALGEIDKASREAIAEYEEFKKDNVELDTGEWVDKEAFNELDKEDQKLIVKVGIDKFGKAKKEEFEQENKQLSTGEWIDLEQYNSLPKQQQKVIYEQGVAGYDRYIKDNFVILKTGEFLPKAEWDVLNKDEQKWLMTAGVDSYNEIKQGLFEMANKQLDTKEWMDKVEYNALSQDDKVLINSVGTEKFNQIKQDEIDKFNKEHIVIGEQALLKDDWAKLAPEYKAIALSSGFDAMNKQIEIDKAEFESAHIKLDTGEHIPLKGYIDEKGNEITGYSDLSKEDQDYLNINGIDAFNARVETRVEGVESFGEAEARMLAFDDRGQIIALGMLGYSNKTYKELTKAEQKDAIEKFIVKVPAEAFEEEEGLKYIEKLNWEFQMQHYLIPTLAMIPVVGTIVFWDKMSTTDKIISGVLDVLIIASILVPKGIRAIKTRKVIGTAKKAGQAAGDMELSLKVLKATPLSNVKYASISSNAQKAIQASKVADAKFIEALERVKVLSSSQLSKIEKLSKIKGLGKALEDLGDAQANLKVAWNIARKYKEGSEAYIKSLTEVNKAQINLAKAISNFEGKLAPRYLETASPEFKGYLAKWQRELKPILKPGEPFATPLSSGGRGKQLMVLEKVATKVEIKPVYKLKLKPIIAKKIAEKVKVVAPKVKKATETAKISTATAKAAILAKMMPKTDWLTISVSETIPKEAYGRMTQEQIRRHYGTEGFTIVEAIGKPMAHVSIVVSGLTSVDPAIESQIKTAVASITRVATKEAVKAMEAKKTASQVRSIVRTTVKNRASTLTQPVVRSLVATMTETITNVALRVATQVKAGIVPKLITPIIAKITLKPIIGVTPIINLPDGTRRHMTREEVAGAVAWKQGFIYIMIYPPYKPQNIEYSRKPFPGIKVVKGARSAYETVVKLGQKIPSRLAYDMGIMDIEIITPKGGTGKPKLKFKADPKQKTKQTGISMAR